MATRKKKPEPVEDENASLIAQLEELVASQAQALDDMARELAEVKTRVASLPAKPVRAFRGRKIEHGPLRVSITPVEDITDAEVYVKFDGDVLMVLVGSAAIGARGGYVPHFEAPSQQLFAPPPEPQRLGGLVRPLSAAAEKWMQQEADLSKVIAYGAQFGLSAEESAAIAIGNVDMTTGLMPAEIVNGPPNVTLQPQANPSQPGGWQDRSEAGTEGSRYGWGGVGPRPKGWTDPDFVPPSSN